jgi:hypothetical protein
MFAMYISYTTCSTKIRKAVDHTIGVTIMPKSITGVDEQTLREQYQKIVVVPVAIPDGMKFNPNLFKRPSLYGKPQKVITRTYAGV